ncbi:type IX secretion system membrane protein PorP/SprF [bacterium]|nr:type IX secretion system membrane protein PorP/SprF [bacterium]
MKRFLTLALVLTTVVSQAQQIPLYSNAFFTPFVYNPAQSGSKGVTEAALIHRRQWADVQGSPETSALTLNGAMNKQKFGYSLYGYSDRTDVFQQLGIYGAYAYHVQLSEKNYLSFGLGAGYLNRTIDLQAVRVVDPNDPVLLLTPSSRGVFDLNAGVNLRISGLQIGVAVPQLLNNKIKYSENYNGDVFFQLIRHYVVNASYDLEVQGDRMVLTPYVLLRSAENVPIQFDGGAMFNMKKYGYVGAQYRSDYAVTASLGVYLTDELSVGYSHDFSTSDYSTALGTSNEFMLRYSFGSNARNERLENEIKKLKANDKAQMDQMEERVDERLEEFKDQLKKEQAAAAAANPPVVAPNPNNAGGTGNQDNNAGNTNVNPVVPVQPNANPNNNATANGGYPAENLATSVEPGSKGFYVVAGVFSSEANARRQLDNVTGQGLQARFFRDPVNGFYYVYVLKFNNYRDAAKAKSTKMNGAYNGELWIKIVE